MKICYTNCGLLMLTRGGMYFITQHPITMTGSTVRKPRSPTRTFTSITSPANHAAKVKTVAPKASKKRKSAVKNKDVSKRPTRKRKK